MLVNFAVSIHLIPGSALKLTPGLPWNPRNALQVPPDEYHVFRRLPNPVHLNPNLPEQDFAMKPQRPEYQFVPLNPTERVQRIREGYIVPGKPQKQCKTAKKTRELGPESEREREREVPVDVVIEVSGED